ncbi:zinc finger, CCHC-type, Retrotransposon gag domain protein [Artemisia annua]|uniref:Zinc finger, CCHC-type, Retrotransposon gag domain protein n=1 Tax=Artemisia annua TaxID=35608 RepID=A0A2U1M550_ARTAN|nr:zinc finger, CCHC-type, Retrotransposon gag domain protein [Artemisia annua]
MKVIHSKGIEEATTSKHVESSASETSRDDKRDGSSSFSSSGSPNLEGFSEEQTKAFDDVKKKGGFEKGTKNDKATYRDFTACDVLKFTGKLNPIVSTGWLTAVEGVFRTSACEDKKKVIYASNYLCNSAKSWWEGKVCEKGEAWAETCSWKEFKELFNVEYAPAKEVDKIRDEFQSLTQTHETVNELWKKFNDMIPYCPEYHSNEKLKVDKFQRMLKDDICEVISPFKCITLEDLLSRARVREADIARKKNKEVKEPKRK